jgi:hypothetical protein
MPVALCEFWFVDFVAATATVRQAFYPRLFNRIGWFKTRRSKRTSADKPSHSTSCAGPNCSGATGCDFYDGFRKSAVLLVKPFEADIQITRTANGGH